MTPYADLPNSLTPEKQRFMEECIRIARKRGLQASGSHRFDLLIPSLTGETEILPLSSLFEHATAQSSNAPVIAFIQSLLDQRQAELSRGADFVDQHLRIVTVSGPEADREWARLFENYQVSGEIPVILPKRMSPKKFTNTVSTWAGRFEKTIEMAMNIVPSNWFEKQKCELATVVSLTDVSGDLSEEGLQELSYSAKPTKHRGALAQRVHIACLRLPEPWHVSATIGFGGWNCAPNPDVQAGLFKYWSANFGATVMRFEDDSIECFVAKPPASHAEAVRLAWEHYFFCPDIVEQGTGTIAALVRIPRNSSAIDAN